MKVRAIIDFRDRENGLRLRKKGTVSDVDEKRAKKLLDFGYVEKAERSTGQERRTENDQM